MPAFDGFFVVKDADTCSLSGVKFHPMNHQDCRGFTFTPLILFVGLWLIFAVLLIRFMPLPLWASVPLALLAEILVLRLCDVIFNR
jgi:hypothetical protein